MAIFRGILRLIGAICVICCISNNANATPDATHPFELTTIKTNTFQFYISAAGTFYVDCGDNGTLTSDANDITNNDTITRLDTNGETYTCTWTSDNTHTIRFGGSATGYDYDATIRFNVNTNEYWNDTNAQKISSISGSLGQIFGTVETPTAGFDQPRFYFTFYGASNMTGTDGIYALPQNLFDGIYGTPVENMFAYTFGGCSGLTGSIPEDLFGRVVNDVYYGISGAPTNSIFAYTFGGCSGLTGSIPEDLFGRVVNDVYYGISGAPADGMFDGTFRGCGGLTGSIPADLFGRVVNGVYHGISGTPANGMFNSTFNACSGLNGTIPVDLFGRVVNGVYYGISGTPAGWMFAGTFSGCSGLTGTIPADLFGRVVNGVYHGISGTPANGMFDATFWGCSGLTGTIPAGLFSGISGEPAGWMFSNTFNGCSGLTGTIPADLFGRVVNGVYHGISGTPTDAMFAGTFWECSGLTGSIPADLFGRVVNDVYYGISGTPANSMFNGTFGGCGGLTGPIPADLFGRVVNDVYYGISGAPAYAMFNGTFRGCGGLTGTNIPDSNNSDMNYAIPPTLFGNISGAPTESMFSGTFSGCSGLTGSIPADLFSGISGTPTKWMFANTFSSCSGLTGSIPENLFSGISGTPADGMFTQTFWGCSDLTGSISPTLFGNIYGVPAENMFHGTFVNCGGLTKFGDNTYVPGNFLNGIDVNTSVSEQVSYMFSGTQLDSTCPAGTYTNTREQFSDAGKPWCSTCPDGTSSIAGATSVNDCLPAFTITFNLNSGSWPAIAVVPESYIVTDSDITLPIPTRTGFSFGGWYDNEQFTGDAITTIPSGSTGDKVFWAKWTPEYKFTLTTTETEETNTFQFYISAAGTFYVDCGDNGTLTSTANDVTNNDTITRSDVSPITYTCTWDNATAHTIRFGGSATGYSTSGTTAAVRFNINISKPSNDTNAKKISSISGSLGQIFSTVENPSTGSGQPRFYQTFYRASNMTGTDGDYALPQNLFDGISGAPVSYIFSETFRECRELTGQIPSTLFGGISGAPATYMFNGTFYGCGGLSGTDINDPDNQDMKYAIPPTLFSNISGTPANYMFSSTFSGCDGLIGSIPKNLFSGISGAPAQNMFASTFYSCKGLTGSIPADLFGRVVNGVYHGIHGAPAISMFGWTFRGCDGLTGSIPQDLFGRVVNGEYHGISGKPAKEMFSGTFYNCSGLTGTNIDDPNNQNMKYAIPPTLFSGISGKPADSMFGSTFSGCSGLTGSIPATLFSGIHGTPVWYMFADTFNNCSGLSGPIPSDLFGRIVNGEYRGIFGKPATRMFSGTFSGCKGLTGSIPADLFGRVDENNVYHGITGAAAEYMFCYTFNGCKGLTGPIPENLFGRVVNGQYYGVSGAAQYGMFLSTFENCIGLNGVGDNTYVPGTFLDKINNSSGVWLTRDMFYGTQLDDICPAGTYDSTRTLFSNAGKPLCTPCPDGTYSVAGATACVSAATIEFNLNNGSWPAGAVIPESYIISDPDITLATPIRTGFTFGGWYDNEQFTGDPITTIPSGSTGDKVFWAKWNPEYKFTLTTTETDSFQFYISATGTFYIDCGDNGTLTSTANDVTNNDTITRSDVSPITYTCTWDNTTAHTIRFGGVATGYSTSGTTAAVRFNVNINEYWNDINAVKISSISGSLGQIFGTIENPTVGSGQPRFYYTFSYASNMTGNDGDYALPQNLFDGISGAPADYMFSNTFSGCNGLSGSIPATLFGNISGAPADYMFYGTFDGCSSLSGPIPESLFGNISGAPAEWMFSYTFSGCSGLSGTIPSTLFGNISGAPASSMFNSTFSGCSSLTGSIPSTLFGNISGAPASNMFSSTFYGCSGLSGSIPSTLFGNISGAPAQSMFSDTFWGCSSLTGSIPSTLFGNISGAPADYMFSYTFSGCSGLSGTIPSTLFGNISGTPAGWMFAGTFSGCSGLSETIPENLFGNISGAPAWGMFSGTFSGCSGLSGTIPSTLFGNISGAPAQSMFNGTFSGCSGLSGTIPSTLFGNISGAPAQSMFEWTFSGCSGLSGTIPSTLFGNISGAPAVGMFYGTFSGCSGLSGSIPATLFGNISGAPADYMFSNTFNGCSGLSGPIPATLFSNISGAPASSMFNSTFAYCSGLSGTIPSTLFGNISGAPAQSMFEWTFSGCSGLSGFGDNTYVPGDFLNGIGDGTSVSNQVTNMFSSTQLDNTCPAGTYTNTREQFDNAGKPWCSTCPDGTSSVAGATSVNDCLPAYTVTYNCGTGTGDAPENQNVINGDSFSPSTNTCTAPNKHHFNGWLVDVDGEILPANEPVTYNYNSNITLTAQWEPEYPFTLTTTKETNSFQFYISAAGTFYVDCGDNGTLTSTAGDITNNDTITRLDTSGVTYTCTWTNNNAHTIRFGGFATGYSTSGTTAAIRFNIDVYWNDTNVKKISSISGSLGQIFGTVEHPTVGSGQPTFSYTFYGASNMTGNDGVYALPQNLFDGIYGAPANYMFYYTFYGCSGLTGSIPENLFGNLSGTPADYMFMNTFMYCRGLTGTNIPDSNNQNMKYAIPPTLFNGIYGKPADHMFVQTFAGCSSLTGSIPENLFSGISGTPAQSMFFGTFSDCIGLTGSIPANLFGRVVNDVYHGISGAPAYAMFTYTFSGCSKLTGSIPEDLFSGISGAPAENMFWGTFAGCSSLTGSIPANLFGRVVNDVYHGISGAPADYMFASTFSGCSGLTGTYISDPDNPDMKYAIPPTLFNGISGAPAQGMFSNTFTGCSGLTGSIPADLFSGISGTPAEGMFWGTFQDCSGLTGFGDNTYVSGDFLSGIEDNTTISNQVIYMFGSTQLNDICPSGTYNSTRTQFSDADKPWCSTCPDGTTSVAGATSVNDCAPAYTITFNLNNGSWPAGVVVPESYIVTNSDTMLPVPTRTGFTFGGWYDNEQLTGDAITNIPSGSTGDKVFWAKWKTVEYKFTLTTTATNSFQFYISAAGTFFVDCGDNGTLTSDANDVTNNDTITRFDINSELYTCTWDNTTAHTIRFGGSATGYNTDAAIRFNVNINEYWNDTNAVKISSISGSLGQIFGTVENPSIGSNQPRFNSTFYGASNMTGNDGIYALPQNLFDGISGTPAQEMFWETFAFCSGLTGSIPSTLFSGISGAPANNVFQSTFFGCTGLTGSIPADLFSGISGAPAHGMFSTTFSGCSGLTGSIPADLFGNISGTPAAYMFSGTFSGCSGLTGSIPPDLFSGISGEPAEWMFWRTFEGCNKLNGSIPADLFSGISGKPAGGMFAGTFYGCNGLTGSIPEDLFSGISGTPAQEMFTYTFFGCSRLTGSIPATLFSGISGTPAGYMFVFTFNGCSGLTGSIPEDLFSGISGTPAQGMFYGTFAHCSGLTRFGNKTYISGDFLNGIEDDTSIPDQVSYMFSNTQLDSTCPAGTYNSTREQFSDADKPWCSTCPDGTSSVAGATSVNDCAPAYTITFNLNNGSWPDGIVAPESYIVTNSDTMLPVPIRTGFSFGGWYDNEQLTGDAITTIPSGSTGDKVFWAKWKTVEYKFTLTTIETDSFQFNISAAGTFFVDCGDNGTLTSDVDDVTNNNTITRLDTNGVLYTCKYMFDTAHTIRFGGSATGYNTDTAAIRFNIRNNATKISSISGSLGQIFGTVENPSNGYSGQPKFNYTFSGASYMTGTDGDYALPQNLFDGIYGAPVSNMFKGTFNGCSGLTGSIPPTLFGRVVNDVYYGISGTPASNMFNGTFSGCSSLTGSIPADLFSGISGTPAVNMFASTFSDCIGLTGSIPSTLFSGISGTPAKGMFTYTFSGCSGLTKFGDNTYIPGNFLNGIDDNTSVSYQAEGMFSDTQLDDICPAGTYADTREQFNDAGKPWCSPCPNGGYSAAGATSVNDCIPAYTITFNLKNGSWPAIAVVPESYSVTDSDITLPVPIRTNYIFGGWYDNEQFTGDAITTITAGSTGDKVFWAKWLCPEGYFAPDNVDNMCFPHVLHIRDELLYMKSEKSTTPSLTIRMGDDTFYANMTTTQTPMTYGSETYLKVRYNGQVYYVCDDTVYAH